MVWREQSINVDVALHDGPWNRVFEEDRLDKGS